VRGHGAGPNIDRTPGGGQSHLFYKIYVRTLWADLSMGRPTSPHQRGVGHSRPALHHPVVAELLDCAGLPRGLDRVGDAAGLAAFVTGDGIVRRQHGRAGKAMVAAGRALADRAEDEISGHGIILYCVWRWRLASVLICA